MAAGGVNRWWTDHGWWRHGSRLQTQLYVNRRPLELTQEVFEALPSLVERRPVKTDWVVPLERDDFSEPKDGAMLGKLGLERLAPALAEFWPAGGPVWDALAIVTFEDGGSGVLLGEGKNYVSELYSGGSQAGKSGTERALKSRRRIEHAIEGVQAELGVPVDARRWLDPLDPTVPDHHRSTRLRTASPTRCGSGDRACRRGCATYSSPTTRCTTQPAGPSGCASLQRLSGSSAQTRSSSRSLAIHSFRRSIPSRCFQISVAGLLSAAPASASRNRTPSTRRAHAHELRPGR